MWLVVQATVQLAGRWELRRRGEGFRSSGLCPVCRVQQMFRIRRHKSFVCRGQCSRPCVSRVPCRFFFLLFAERKKLCLATSEAENVSGRLAALHKGRAASLQCLCKMAIFSSSCARVQSKAVGTPHGLRSTVSWTAVATVVSLGRKCQLFWDGCRGTAGWSSSRTEKELKKFHALRPAKHSSTLCVCAVCTDTVADPPNSVPGRFAQLSPLNGGRRSSCSRA